MPRPRKLPYTQKRRVGITPDPSIMNWVLERIGAGKRFGSITHAFECGIVALQKEEGEAERHVRKRPGQ